MLSYAKKRLQLNVFILFEWEIISFSTTTLEGAVSHDAFIIYQQLSIARCQVSFYAYFGQLPIASYAFKYINCVQTEVIFRCRGKNSITYHYIMHAVCVTEHLI